MRLRLATRGSVLAWTQAGTVADSLRSLGHEVDMVRITTSGDVTTAPLSSLGGAGVFVGAVRAAVLSGECDLAVHSFKDLPTAPVEGLRLGAVPPREDPSDALCGRGNVTLAALPAGATVGTGSPRRAAQLRARRPDLEVVDIRGNVETRLRRTATDLDAVVLASAGLRRLGLADRISEAFDPDDFLPAPAQGALAVECRSDAPAELLAALAALDDTATRLAALAERAVLSGLQAGCAAPVAAHARVAAGRLTLTATVVSVDGRVHLMERADAGARDAASALALGADVAGRLLASGAGTLVNLAAAKPRPLAGRRVLLPTRAPAGLAEAIRAAGAEVVQAEFTRQEPLPLSDLDAATAQGFDWVVVTSTATLAALAASGYDLSAHLTPDTKVAAIGPATANALTAAGLVPDLAARPGGGAALVAAFPSGPGRVLLPGAAEPSAEPAAGLTAKGWAVQRVAVYRTVAAELPATVTGDWSGFDAFVVTAGSVARAAVAAAGLPGPKVVAIGRPAAAASAAVGLEVSAVAASPDTGGLVDALLATLA